MLPPLKLSIRRNFFSDLVMPSRYSCSGDIEPPTQDDAGFSLHFPVKINRIYSECHALVLPLLRIVRRALGDVPRIYEFFIFQKLPSVLLDYLPSFHRGFARRNIMQRSKTTLQGLLEVYRPGIH